MLTRELAIAEYSRGQILPDRLTQKRHARYLALAEQMLSIYRNGSGLMREQLHRQVRKLFENEPECPIRRIDAFCKLLDERGKYDRDRRGLAADLRRQVFRMAGKRFPLVSHPDQLFESAEDEVKQEIAAALKTDWAGIERDLFSDVVQFHRLVEFEGYAAGADLLARYNVAQSQAVLYDAVSMTVWASDDFKLILRYAKLARLMHTITLQEDGHYVIQFDGPLSVIRQTRRYGVAFAKFLPALLSCSGWKMRALIQHRKSSWQNVFQITPADGLRSNVATADLFDSKLEEAFAEKWGDEPRAGWRLVREGAILHSGQKVFVPDFVFVHEDGRRVLLEIVGFWTPEYLSAKRATLALFKSQKILLAVSDSVDWDEETDRDNRTVFRYKTALKVNDLLKRLEPLESQ